jgi:hypothetical protein
LTAFLTLSVSSFSVPRTATFFFPIMCVL